MAAPGESYFPAFPPRPKPYVLHGLPFDQACAHHAANTFHASRIYVIVSRSISKTEAFARLRAALGDRLAGVRYGMLPHTPWDDVLATAADLRAQAPDLIVTLGAGSITDGVKLARLLAANAVKDMAGVDALAGKCAVDLTNSKPPHPDVQPAAIPVINIPTTLSGGEFTPAGGATDLTTSMKRVLAHESMFADIVVLDPALSTTTPARFWLSTGVRAVDHCVEGLYGNLPTASGETSAALADALRALLVGLLETRAEWGNLDARLRSMLAVKESIRALGSGIGASHGIGHQLGPLGVGHGETSCVMLPCVLRYNWAHGDAGVREKLRQVVDVFWSEPTVLERLGLKGADRQAANPGDLVAAFVMALGMPSTLGHFGIGSDKFDALAENAMRDWCTTVNPVKLDQEKVVEILQMAA
ncbi:hypothetical protein F5B20DRAFT_566076 [Whalleya microplaca]|nr:hypothetical protein F5B20DRAFT_566076 [Whalleya microplaca]